MRIDIHVLQNFAPSNLNRDDTGRPKDAEFGGYRRARISSQCQKRAIRKYFMDHNLIDEANRATRTKRLMEHLSQRLTKPGRDNDSINRAVAAALAAGGLKLVENNLTQYLLFIGEAEIARLASVIEKHFEELAKQPKETATGGADTGKKKTAKKEKAEAKLKAPEEVQKAVPALLDGGKAADLALFGRMLADLPEKNVVAACQVAHAISTNKIHSMEMDYYTAVDDLKPEDTAGADMIGTVEFNSACFYRFANLDVTELVGGFRDEKKTRSFGLQGDTDLARTTVNAFLQAFIHSIPTGKQNSFAAHNRPSLVFAVAREGQPVSLANAFVKPVTPRDGDSLLEKSIESLDDYYGRLIGMYGNGGLRVSSVCQMEGVKLKHLKEEVGSIENLIAAVSKSAFDGKGAA